MGKSVAGNRNQSDDQEIRDRAIRLFTFLRELTELRSKIVRTVDQYETVLWFDKIPRGPGCYCVAWQPPTDQDQSEVWVEVRKPRLKAPPKIPEILTPWLDLREVEDSARDLPNLRDRSILDINGVADEQGARGPQPEFHELADHPEIKPLWERYVERDWWPWAAEDRELQAVQQVYADLFTIYQKQQRLGEAYEAVLGLGYLTWKTPNGSEVRRHLITAQTSLQFDAVRGRITLGPAGEGPKPSLEQDMLEPQERPEPEQQNAIERQVAEIGDALWDGIQVQAALKGWVHSASPQGLFEEGLAPQKDMTSNPKIHLAPAVILRKRTERSLLRMYQDIIQQLRSGHAIPAGVRRLVTIVDDIGSQTQEIGTADPSSDQLQTTGEVYFPLPANDEQLEIVEKLARRQGVLVQGPPGTGKSHTIANLVCHLLALGQRVLVTSHTARALRVLEHKFPEEIEALCVVLLGDDLNALQHLEESVQGITDRFNSWDRERNERAIASLEKSLDEARRAEARVLNDLRGLRESEAYLHPLRFGSYEGTAQTIASRLRKEEPAYSWISASPTEGHEPPVNDGEASELIGLLREISGAREEELSKRAIDPAILVTPDEYERLVREESRAAAQHAAAEAERNHQGYEALSRVDKGEKTVVCPQCGQKNRILPKGDATEGEWTCGRCKQSLPIPVNLRKSLVEALDDLLKAHEAVSHDIQPWARESATQILADRDRAWRELQIITREHLEAIGDRARRVSDRQISGLEGRDPSVVKGNAAVLLQHLEAGKGLGFGPFRPRAVRDNLYLLREVRIDGRPCDNPQCLRDLLQFFDIGEHLSALQRHWSPLIKVLSGSMVAQVAEYWDLLKPLERVLELRGKVETLKGIIGSIPGLAEPTWYDVDQVRSLLGTAEAVSLEWQLSAARGNLEAVESHFRPIVHDPNAHPIVNQILEAARARDERAYAASFAALQGLRELSARLNRRRELLKRLETEAPGLAPKVTGSFSDPAWDRRMAEFEAAWNWARADTWLKRLSEPGAEELLTVALEYRGTLIRETIRKLAAARAWGFCFLRLTERERQHLMAWTKAMRRVGKGTGKYAGMHRKAAREHMEECRSAIPAWVMPIYRVAETVRPGTDTFDVVIVDEASQSGPEALFLQYLAKRIVIVGDDKQISPDFVGITREDVELLRQRYIADLPHGDALGVDNSFFDQGEIRYGGRIRLREHFRCMPEIIQFSNDLCYRSEPLEPLRQYGTSRILPIVVACHVRDGYLRGQSPKVVNPPEAHALVDQIEKCCEDPAYSGKTMGVISLLGEDQARYIEKQLLEKLGPEEMEGRQIICGDAYAFQGDERDVMFLSLVSAPTEGHRIGTLASQRDERRFNVAASRARDQMWLFHTATLNDLSPTDLRYRLVEYCQNPKVALTSLEGLNIDALRVMAQTNDRARLAPPQPFESWFELDVFLKIVSRGYRVIPQFQMAGRWIDLVVEGMRGRLAVECDGDSWHGAEQYEEDTARERMLVRCGLTFWRVRGSTFYRDPEAALDDLWKALDRLRIFPTSQVGESPADGGRTVQTPKLDGRAHGAEQAAPSAGGTRESGIVQKDSTGKPPGVNETSFPDFEMPHLLKQNTAPDQNDDGHLLLSQYRTWPPHPLPDPRSVPAEEVIPGLVDIISVEGPMVCSRAYHVYAAAAGIRKVGRQIRSIFNRAIRRAVREGLLEDRDEYGNRDQISRVVWKAGTAAVVLRTRGNRTFYEIPPSELGAMMSKLLRQNPELTEQELLRSVLSLYEIGRLTSNIEHTLRLVRDRFASQNKRG